MQASKRYSFFKLRNIIIAFLLLTAIVNLPSCKQDVLQTTVYDNTIYDVNPVTLYVNNADKVKQKTSTQYISILYSDLFNQSISGTQLNDLNELTLSVGDKTVVNDMLLQKMLATSGIDIPTDSEMRSNVDAFIDATYIKFFLRHPSPYEAYFMKKYIQDDLSVTPQMVYASFALSNEYLFY
jgi:hypothetical protein